MFFWIPGVWNNRNRRARPFRFYGPNFCIGLGSALDLGGTLSLTVRDIAGATPEQADALALARDWYVVGQDIRAGMKRFEQETATQ